MNIIIIEDELKTARALAKLITEIKPGAKVAASIQSIETAVKYLSENTPDLIFMDIQLADGLCFEIFKQVQVTSPVVFCTAYDEYAITAFKSNGVDYILKPFSKETITAGFEKVDLLTNFFQKDQSSLPDIAALISSMTDRGSKKSFLVFKQNKYISIATDQIAFFYIRNDTPTIVTFKEEEYGISQSLDEVYNQLLPSGFFRLNRQYLVGFKAVKEVEHYFGRKLFVKLTIPTPEKLLIGKDKTTAFLSWLENR
jgi:two-component system response regulator LytT